MQFTRMIMSFPTISLPAFTLPAHASTGEVFASLGSPNILSPTNTFFIEMSTPWRRTPPIIVPEFLCVVAFTMLCKLFEVVCFKELPRLNFKGHEVSMSVKQLLHVIAEPGHQNRSPAGRTVCCSTRCAHLIGQGPAERETALCLRATSCRAGRRRGPSTTSFQVDATAWSALEHGAWRRGRGASANGS